MVWDTIEKSAADKENASLPDPDAARRAFSWQEARRALDGLPGGGLNIAHEALDRHVAAGKGDRLAIRWLGQHGATRDLSYDEVLKGASKFANILAAQGIGRGDRLFSMMGRTPELYFAALGTLRAGAVFTPLFSAFGPEPVRTRMEIGEASALITTPSIYRRKIAAWRHHIPSLKLVLIVGDDVPDDCVALGPEFDRASDSFDPVHTGPEDMALIHFTSGTTGRPKGVVHVHEAVVTHAATGRNALELRPGTVYWCTADPGWVTGTSYGIISPLVNGVTMIVDEADYDLDRWYKTLEREKVEVWYTCGGAFSCSALGSLSASQGSWRSWNDGLSRMAKARHGSAVGRAEVAVSIIINSIAAIAGVCPMHTCFSCTVEEGGHGRPFGAAGRSQAATQQLHSAPRRAKKFVSQANKER